MSKIIRGSKAVNGSLITTVKDQGVTLKTFYCLIEKFNQQYEYEPLQLTKSELWDLCGLTGEYNSKDIHKLIEVLTRSETYNLKGKNIINGSIFVTEILASGNIDIHVPKPFRKHLFYERDVKLMTKAKKRERMTIEDLDYYDREVKMKSKELVLLNKAHILGLTGKYNIRLYTLLKQRDKIGKYEKSWGEFKDIMEVPNSYKSSDIDKHVLNKAKTELLKANIKITKIEKIKKGRSIDKIRILFKTVKPKTATKDKTHEKETKSPVKANKEVIEINRTKASRQETIKEFMKENTGLKAINFTLKMMRYEEVTKEEYEELKTI